MARNWWVLPFIFTLSILYAAPKETKTYKYDLAICAMFRDEAPYLKEWIEFHKLVGVQHFYLFNNLSKDNYLEVLDPYIQAGEVEITDWPLEDDPKGLIWARVHWMAFDEGLKQAQTDGVRWMACIDVDEFFFPVKQDQLLDELKKFEKKGIGGVVVNWQNYGSSYLVTMPPHKLLIEALTYRARQEHKDNFQIKSIVRPEFVRRCNNSHRMFYIKGYGPVNENYVPTRFSRSDKVSINKLRINHYWSRTEDHFYAKKVPWRQNKVKVSEPESLDALEERMYHYNRVIETHSSIHRYVPRLRQRMGLDP